MKNILILTDKYYLDASSNGICAANLARELIERGFSVSILSIYDKQDTTGICGEKIYTVASEELKVNLYSKLFLYMQDNLLVKKLCDKVFEINNFKKIDCIVSFYRPIEAIMCGSRASKLIGALHIPCFFDIPETTNMNNLKKIIISLNYKRLFNKLAAQSYVFCLKYYENYFISNIKNKNKIGTIGIPSIMTKTKSKCTEIKQGESINILYAGSFYNKIRNPEKVLEFLRCIIGKNISLHLYSWGCDDIVEKYKAIYGNQLILHGKIDCLTLKKEMEKAHIFLNISNDTPLQVPGKVLEYFSYGKPVINFRFRKNDAGNEEYEKYPCIYNVDLFENNKDYNCLNFIETNYSNSIDYSIIYNTFYDSTPKYFADKIIESMNSYESGSN